MKKKSIFSLLVLLITLLILISPARATPQTPAGILSAKEGVNRAVKSLGFTAPTAPQACPAGCGLPNSIESSDGFPFCVYYDSADTTLSEAQDVRDYTDDYWDVYENDFGWAMPTEFTNGMFKVCLIDNGTSCNGSVSIGSDSMNVWEGCDSSTEMMMAVVGHELAHAGPQLGPNNLTSANFDALWAHEGMARSGEDKVFNIVDNDAGAMARPFSYNKEVDEFFVSPNHDLTSDSWRYESAIWWTYYAEQCGSDPATEPGLGVADAFGEFWDTAQTSDNIAALNIALNTLGCPAFNTMVPKFVLANYTKDLTSLPDSSYYYIDETNPGNPDTYGPLSPHDGGTIDSGTTAVWNNRSIARYGADYFIAAPDPADCPVITAQFHADSGSPFYHVVTSNAGAFNTHVQGSGTDWVQSFMNDGVTTIAAIAGSLSSSSQVDITLGCADPAIDIKMPNVGAPMQVQGNTKFLAQVSVNNGSPTGPVVGGLTNGDFSARVGGTNAAVVGGGFIQEQYWLLIRAPSGLADGLYELEVMLEEPGTSTVIATDTEFASVEYTSDKVDHVLVIDRSGSMGYPDNRKINAAKAAANLYVDITRTGDGLSVVPYDHDVTPSLVFDMASVTALVRDDAKDNYITPLTPGGATSIGDGLAEAVNQRNVVSTTGNPLCSFVLLSDGMENSSQYWSNVKASVQATGCPVTTIAFGQASNETLMQTIATDTGGLSYYNDVFESAAMLTPGAVTPITMTLDLGNTYEYIQGQSEGRQRFMAEIGGALSGITETHEVIIDESTSEALFIVDWDGTGECRKNGCPALKLIKPDGSTYEQPYDFDDILSGHRGWRVPNPEPGIWLMLVWWYYGINAPAVPTAGMPYQVMASGQSDLTLNLILPGALQVSSTGFSFPIFAILSDDNPIPCQGANALVTAPDGKKTLVPLFDDGEHGDGLPRDGLCGNIFTRANQADPVEPPDEGVPNPPPAEDEGGYKVVLTVDTPLIQRQAIGAFAILEGADSDGDTMPDAWEDTHGLNKNDPNDDIGDPDTDYLLNADEYGAGTDPNNSDTDGGGENDGSEDVWGQDPLDPSDDQIEAPDFFHAAPDNGKVQLTYDVKGEYAGLELWKAPSLEGPWNQAVSELPLDGAYEDPVPNGETYYYRLFAGDGATTTFQPAAFGHLSAVLTSESVTPSVDPWPPEADVIINGGATSTTDRNVTLSFTPLQDNWGADAFSDIVEMKISNDPSLAGADWQLFAQDVPWILEPRFGELVQVYVLFKDASDNESVGPSIGIIFYDAHGVYLPLMATP